TPIDGFACGKMEKNRPFHGNARVWHTLCVANLVRRLFSTVLVFATRLLLAESGVPEASEIPLQFREVLLWLEINAPQSKEPLHFLVDSGASVSVVNLTTAKHLGVSLGSKVDGPASRRN